MRALIVLTSIVLALFMAGCASSNSNAEANVPVYNTGAPDSIVWVLIPAGDFYKTEHAHLTKMDYDYEIMRYDVTNAQYARYLNEALAKGTIKMKDNKIILGYYPGDPFNGHKHEFKIGPGDYQHMDLSKPGVRIKFDGQTFSVQKGFENHPVTMVSWFGAKAFADFYGWRLPTENEWEKAARGTDKRSYPWGNDFDHTRANFYGSHDPFEKLFGKQGGTTPIGFYNGKTYDGFKTTDSPSPYGLYDMVGNVWQWCADDYPDIHYRYMRGGSFATYENNLRVWERNSAGPEYEGTDVGFRCARDAQK
jgi:formylglycine-generating enzyme required for sulfatase activity